MNDHTPDEIAAAIQGHLKALRLLGRDMTSMSAIADALHVTDFDVKATMEAFKIPGAKIDGRRSVSHIRHGTTFSLVVNLKPWKGK